MADSQSSLKSCCPGSSSCEQPTINRRTFIKAVGAGVASTSLWACEQNLAFAGPLWGNDHYVPKDKKLHSHWLKQLFARGQQEWFQGKDLDTIAMPIGGICAGQMYLNGEGQLEGWQIFNQHNNTGFGKINYEAGRHSSMMVNDRNEFEAYPDVGQGFALQVKQGGKTRQVHLNREHFPTMKFSGQYPVAQVNYAGPEEKLGVALKAYSPFIPLNPEDSSLPATVMEFTFKNHGSEEADITFAGWLENAIGWVSRHHAPFEYHNHLQQREGLSLLSCKAQPVEPQQGGRPPLVFEDFEKDTYAPWKIKGTAFGDQPSQGPLPGQDHLQGFEGERLANSYLTGKRRIKGRLRSPTFKIERPYISFLIASGQYSERTSIRLMIDGKIVRSSTGNRNWMMRVHNWSVEEFIGQNAMIEINDTHGGDWGHIEIDHIEFRDQPRLLNTEKLEDSGTLSLALLPDGAKQGEALGWERIKKNPRPQDVFSSTSHPLGTKSQTINGQAGLQSGIGQRFSLKAGEEKTLTFVLAWHMPHLWGERDYVGHHYAQKFSSANDVIRYLATHHKRLKQQTFQWMENFYDSTLPNWLLDRVGSTLSILSTGTCQWWGNGRFWAWEGVGCCPGTCGHVWNYEQALARLFPSLERSVRSMQDFDPEWGFDKENGAISFRGAGGIWAGDSQGGYILKAYREYQTSEDQSFLKKHWPQIKLATQFLIKEDGNGDGLLEGEQHNTYDIEYYGANTMVGSMYLGALRAAEEMARDMGDPAFAKECRRIFESGSRLSVERLFNGEYFIQDVDLKEHPKSQYGDGCLSDQLLGQSLAHQVGLGYLYPEKEVKSTLQSIWDYCWTPDVAAHNKAHYPERWFAYPGEAGLFTCTWPKSQHLGNGRSSTRYRNEVWTGIEYQVASHMAWEGMVTESLAICRAIHERYHPSKRNPWNEIECGDHYARALASWGMLTALSGFEYHGPKRSIAFAPKLKPEDFKSVFTTAAAWGSYSQKREDHRQHHQIDVLYGQLSLDQISFEGPKKAAQPKVTISQGSKRLNAQMSSEQNRWTLRFDVSQKFEAGQSLQVSFEF